MDFLTGPLMKYIAGGLGVVSLVLGLAVAIQTARLNHAKHDLTNARAEITRLNTSLESLRKAVAASEGNRTAEYTEAKDALSAAALDCRDQVSRARASQRVIRTIVEKPSPIDPVTHCPSPSLVSADELRNALGGR